MLLAKDEAEANHYEAAMRHCGFEPVIVIAANVIAVCKDYREASLFIALMG